MLLKGRSCKRSWYKRVFGFVLNYKPFDGISYNFLFLLPVSKEEFKVRFNDKNVSWFGKESSSFCSSVMT